MPHSFTARLRACRGFSLTEITIILTALTILSGMTVPAVDEYVDRAKLVRGRQDVRILAVSLVRLFSDVSQERSIEGGWAQYDMLVGAGPAPRARGDEAEPWTAVEGSLRVGSIDDQLIRNGAGYARYDARQGFGWRGAYLQEPVGTDPWGSRYAVNVQAMRSPSLDTVVLTAGPDGIVDSPFEIDGLPTTGDDMVSVVSSAGR